MFAAGQECCFLLFCLLFAEEVWNANFTKAGGRKGKDDEKEKNMCLLIKEASSQRRTEERKRMESCRKWADRRGETKHGTEDDTGFESGSVHWFTSSLKKLILHANDSRHRHTGNYQNKHHTENSSLERSNPDPNWGGKICCVLTAGIFHIKNELCFITEKLVVLLFLKNWMFSSLRGIKCLFMRSVQLQWEAVTVFSPALSSL